MHLYNLYNLYNLYKPSGNPMIPPLSPVQEKLCSCTLLYKIKIHKGAILVQVVRVVQEERFVQVVIFWSRMEQVYIVFSYRKSFQK